MSCPETVITSSISEKRTRQDRRRFTWRTVVHGFFRSRRHGHRRVDDNDVTFMDWHHPWLFFLSVGIMLLSAADAAMTLKLLQLGFFEANPVMASFMEKSTLTFAATKMAMTGIGVLMLAFLAKARFMDRVRVGLFLTIIFICYACLICYEIVSLFTMM